MTDQTLDHAILSAFYQTLRSLLQMHLPQASLLASLNGKVLYIEAERDLGAIETELVPPDYWFERGEMHWLKQEGNLLGLLWNQEPIEESVVELFSRVLANAQEPQRSEEFNSLISQLSQPAVWLDAELNVQYLSRGLMELLGKKHQDLLGQHASHVFSEWPALLTGLQEAIAGHRVTIDDLLFSGAGLWLRSEARPFFAAGEPGVLWLAHEVTSEYRRNAQLDALLVGNPVPLAILDYSGTVLQASSGLMEHSSGQLVGHPLWDWTALSEPATKTIRAMVTAAAQRGIQQEAVKLQSGDQLTLRLRPALTSQKTEPLLLLDTPLQLEQALTSNVIELLERTAHAMLLLSEQGTLEYVSEQASQLIGGHLAQFRGLPMRHALQSAGVKLRYLDEALFEQPEALLRDLPKTAEIMLTRPDGATRQLECQLSAIELPNVTEQGVLVNLRDMTALRHAQSKLQHDLRHDSLTGLRNRLGFREQLTQLLADCGPEAGAVACIAVENHPTLLTALGRTALDLMNIQLAARLSDLTEGRRGAVGRLGDNELVIALCGVSAEEITELVVPRLSAPVRAGRREATLSFLVGTASWHGLAAETALHNAETALESVKKVGKGKVQVFNETLRAEAAQTFALEEDLRQAISSGTGLAVVYQPALSLSTQQVTAAEALIRWTHPTQGEISPAQFLSLASQTGQMGKLGAWIVAQVSEQQAIWQKRWPQLRLSVNLSLQELSGEGELARLLPSLPALPHFEVNSDCLLEHAEETLELIQKIKGRGAEVWVDDFGEGVTSLSALTLYPLSGIKLHPNLTAKLPDDTRGVALVEATLALARRLDLQVTAVGVESETQLEELRDLGCDQAQGYAISPPLPAPEFEQWLKQRK